MPMNFQTHDRPNLDLSTNARKTPAPAPACSAARGVHHHVLGAAAERPGLSLVSGRPAGHPAERRGSNFLGDGGTYHGHGLDDFDAFLEPWISGISTEYLWVMEISMEYLWNIYGVSGNN